MATYTVKKGDTLSAIAKQYGTTYQEIAKANGISDPNVIQVGQTLNIGSDDSSATQSTTTAQTETKAPTFEYEAYKPSDTVAQAEALLQQQLANKPGSYQSSWQTQLDDILNKIQNREKFSYDLNGDALYQQYKDQYNTQGKMASMDVMGQAATLTGGYGSSYSQAAGQQAYQGYLQQLNDRIPELYQLALDQYNREGDDLYNQLGLYADRENQDYGRYRDQVSDYYTELNRLTDDSRYQGELDYGKYMDAYNMAYGQYRDQKSDEQWQAEFDEAKRQYDQQYELAAGKNGTTGGNDDDTYVEPYEPPQTYDNEGLSEQVIKNMQISLGVTADGKWGPESKEAAGGLGAKAAYDAWNKGKIGKPVGVSAEFAAAKEKAARKAEYAEWGASEWESYFAQIRQTEGKAAAEKELKEFTSNGYIPQKYVSVASSGARGGLTGH